MLAGRCVSPSGTPRATLYASLATLATGGLQAVPDLLHGCQLLEAFGLLREEDGALQPSGALLAAVQLPDTAARRAILTVCLTSSPPLWLSAATSEATIRYENIPEQAMETLAQTFADLQQRENYLLAIATKVDPQPLAALGEAGEAHVLQAWTEHLLRNGRQDLVSDLVQVSRISDALGYDITGLDATEALHHLEVKTTSTQGRVTFFLSRNEATVGAADEHWSLVVVRRTAQESLIVVGWCPISVLSPHLPSDRGDGRWTTARITLCDLELEEGLPITPANQKCPDGG